MTDPRDNERAALEAMRAETIASGETYEPPSEGGMFWVIAVLGLIVAVMVAAYVADPCASQRATWFINGAGMRGCAFEAKCSINDGSMPHVPKGAGYIWFDKDASSKCGGVKF